MQTMFVAMAGAAGAVARFRLGVAFGTRTFPWVTLAININGSFLLALVLAGPAAGRWSPDTTAAVTIGLLGAYTTFSTFGYETFDMLRNGRTAAASAYLAASIIGGLAAAWAGYALGTRIA